MPDYCFYTVIISDSEENYNFHKENTNSNRTELNLQKPKKHKLYRTYQLVEKFPSIQEAKLYVKKLNVWVYTLKTKSTVSETEKLFYKCNEKTCKKKLQITHDLNDHWATVSISAGDHGHPPIHRGIQASVKQEIMRLVDSDLTRPKEIMDELRSKQFQLPTKIQLTNFLRHYRDCVKFIPLKKAHSTSTLSDDQNLINSTDDALLLPHHNIEYAAKNPTENIVSGVSSSIGCGIDKRRYKINNLVSNLWKSKKVD